VTVNESYATTTGAGTYNAGETVTINAGTRTGFTFSGWTVTSGSITLDDASSATTTFTMPASDVSVTANWTEEVITYTVTVNGSYAATTGAGTYAVGATVTINAGNRSGYDFTGWVTNDGVTFGNANNSTTTFIMPDANVTVTATWAPVPPPPTTRPELPPPPPPGIIVIPETTTSGDTIPGIPYTPKKPTTTEVTTEEEPATEDESATEEEPTAEEPTEEPTIDEPATEEPTAVEIATVEPTAPPAAIGEPETVAPTTVKDSGDVAVPDKTDVDAGPSGPEEPEKDNPKTGDMVLPGFILAMLTTISIGVIVARKKRYTV
jgi:uncharacterized repeat protein (TIGR02543 family)